MTVALALLALPEAALADGTYTFGSDQSHVNAQAKTSDGKNAYYYVFTFPQMVTQAVTSSGSTCPTFMNDPKSVECPGFAPTGGPPSASIQANLVLQRPMDCAD